MTNRLMQKLKKMLKIGVVTGSDDSGSYPTILVSYLGKQLARAVNFTPFGLWSRPLPGMMSMLLSMNGRESNKFAITNELKNRPVKDLEEGEVALGNLLSYFHFKADGNIILTIPVGKFLTINGNVILNGGIQINGAITTDIPGGKLKMTVTEFELDGLMTSTGPITAQGTIQGTELTDGSVPYSTHVHQENGTGGGITNAPQ